MNLSLALLFLIGISGCALDVNGTGLLPPLDAGSFSNGDPAIVTKDDGSVATFHVATDAACNRLITTSNGLGPLPKLCADIQIEGDPVMTNPANYYSATIEPMKGAFLCNLVVAPAACSGCDYTCECFLKVFGSSCSCNQDAPGAYVTMVCP